MGFTVCFDDAGEQYASRFRLRAYDANGVLLKDVLVENIADRCELDVPVEHYRTIIVDGQVCSVCFKDKNAISNSL